MTDTVFDTKPYARCVFFAVWEEPDGTERVRSPVIFIPHENISSQGMAAIRGFVREASVAFSANSGGLRLVSLEYLLASRYDLTAAEVAELGWRVLDCRVGL